MSVISGKKILVTGAGGFIGSHLTEKLVRDGNEVRAFVRYNSFNSWGWLDYAPRLVQENLDVIAGDIRDPSVVQKAVKGCDLVLHLAALISIPYSYVSPETYVETNIRGTLNVLQAARDFQVPKLVHTSTSEVYGSARFVPINEEHPLQGQSPYSATKIAADQLAFSFYRSFSVPVAIVRPFNTYGPRQSARAIIPTVITQIVHGKKIIELGSLRPTRDFNYVKDIVNGFLAVANSDKSIGEFINIGSNYEISIGDTARLIAEQMNVDVQISLEEIRVRPEDSEVERLCADNTKAKKLVGWEPEYNGLEGLKRGLAETIAWFSNPENVKVYKAHVYNI